MKYSAKLRSKLHRFKISKRSLLLLKRAGVKTISLGGGHADDEYAYVRINGKMKIMHRVLMNLLGHNIDGMTIDHKNGNRLDNRIFNLRLATHRQNSFNYSMPKTNTTGFKGVYFRAERNKYVARLRGTPHSGFVGLFDTAREAAMAYNRAAKKYHGKFAKLNCI